jgi:putative DNA primase/helicase
VLKRLIHAGLDDASIAALLMDPANKAGEKARERGLRWLAGEIGRGRAAVGKDLRRYADAGMTAEQVALVLWPYSTPPPSSKAWLHLAWTRTVPDMTGNTPAADAHQRRNGSSNVTSEDIANSWPPLQALPSLLPDVPVLPSLMLPPGLRPWMEDIAERMQVPLEYVAIPGMVAAGALIGRQISIHPKQKDDWFCVPNLWGAIVGRSGLMKSPTLEQALKPLDRLAAQAMDAYKAREERNTTMQEALDAQIAGVKEGLKKAAKENNAALCASVGARLAALQAEREDLIATLRRFKTNDATIQKLGELLRDNPHGMLFFRDELSGWLSSLNQDGREGDREFFLETWNGDGTYTFDRIGRGMIHVDGLCLSIIGGIQPGKLARYVYEACEGGAGDDGLLQRFQLLVWPVHNQAFMNIDRLPKAQERQRAYALYERLADLDTTGLGATTTEFQTIPALRFTPEAQELFDAWRLELETRLRSDTIHSPAFESHLAKYRSLMPSLALIFHLLRKVERDWEGNAVALDVTRLAAEWCEFLEAHARKVYAGVLQKDLQAAHALVDKIRTGALTDGQAPREVYRNGWSLLQTPDDVYGGLTYLERHGWIRVCEEPSGPKGGRPREVIHLHPSLHAEPPT